MEYPQRSSFFAHKFVRLLHKAAVAAEIGRDAFALLVVISHTEDAMRYRGPAKFWNSQLIETLGFKKWDQFAAARKTAVESGWLQYECGGKRKAGEYFVTIPDGYEFIDDSPIEESYPKNGYDIGYDIGYEVGYKDGMIEGMNRVRSGVRSGYEQGEPSIPIPDPIPNPVSCSESSAGSSKPEHGSGIKITTVGRNAGTHELPQSKIDEWAESFPGVDVPAECRKAAQWCLDNPTKRKTWSGVPKFINAWLTREQNNGRRIQSTNGHSKPNGKPRFSDDMLEAIKVCTSIPRSEQWQERAERLGPERAAALKKAGGASSLLEAKSNDFTLQSFAAVYDSILTDIRKATNGTAKSN